MKTKIVFFDAGLITVACIHLCVVNLVMLPIVGFAEETICAIFPLKRIRIFFVYHYVVFIYSYS